MRYFKLETKGNLLPRPVSGDGKFLGVGGDTAERYMLKLQEKSKDFDVLRCAGRNCLFNARTRAIVETFRMQPSVRWVDVDVSFADRACQYSALMQGAVYKILDYEKSIYKWLVPNKLVGAVAHWVFMHEPEFDLFVADNYDWLISERLAKTLLEASVTGLRLPEYSGGDTAC